MVRRPWTRTDLARLYDYASRMPQARAAKKLGRTTQALATKARDLGIVWWQGVWSYAAIAREVDCAPNSVKRAVAILLDEDEIRGAGKRGTTGWRALLSDEQAQRVIRVMQGARRFRTAKIRAGKIRHGREEKS